MRRNENGVIPELRILSNDCPGREPFPMMRPGHGRNQFQEKPSVGARFSGRWSLIHDLSFALAVVLIAGGALAVYATGNLTSPQAGWRFLGPALAGMIAAGILKFILTGSALTPGEAVRDFLFSGLLAASARHLLLWQSPQTLSGLIRLSPVSAAVFYLLYHAANTYRLAYSRKHLDAITGMAITIIPFALGLPLALPSDQLAVSLGSTVTAGLLSGSPAWCMGIGRALLLFSFNVILTQAFALSASRRPLASVTAHLYLLLAAAASIVAPGVADLGSGNFAAGLPGALKPVVAVLATVLSQGALWAEVFMVTGMIMDGMRGIAPIRATMKAHAASGMKKGMVFSGVLMTLLQLLHAIAGAPVVQNLYRTFPALLFAAAGAMAFPLFKAIIETFDGSRSFFNRALRTYREPVLMARGAAVGIAAAVALGVNLSARSTSERVYFGLAAGALAYAGVSALRDLVYGMRNRGGLKSWRLYLVEGGLGAFVGAAFTFYLDSTQIPVVLDKLNLYNTFGLIPAPDDFYPLLSKWGHIHLGTYAGGAKLLFNEALKGVIGWGVAAWLFAVNRSFLTALFQRDTAPIRRMFSRQGAAELTENTIQVLRWGLWMAPVIFTFLKQMSVPTWYNQDGAIHTIFCIFKDATSDTASFQSWSLKVFMWVLAYDFFRILIWIDHMGLRVATLVNLSFIGMDRLERTPRALHRSSRGHVALHSRRRQTLHHLGATADSVFYSEGKWLELGVVAIRSHPEGIRQRLGGNAGTFFDAANGADGNRGGAGRRVCFLWCPHLALTLREREANQFSAGQSRVCRRMEIQRRNHRHTDGTRMRHCPPCVRPFGAGRSGVVCGRGSTGRIAEVVAGHRQFPGRNRPARHGRTK